jgi:hypothetical protein
MGSEVTGSRIETGRATCICGTAEADIGGIIATTVPAINTQTPAHIHITKGLMKTLITGLSVS